MLLKDSEVKQSGQHRYTHGDARIDEFKLRLVGVLLPPIYKCYDALPERIRDLIKPAMLWIQNGYFDMIIAYSDRVRTLIVMPPVRFQVIQPGDFKERLTSAPSISISRGKQEETRDEKDG